ncbi:thioredoxin-like protein [Infundibulicybe gibba]|nr:thioredoxin-like protein [Infundibulicybe gibba]
MSTRVVKLTVINDFHELLTAIAQCKETLRLPLSFEIEHMPFRLISDACLKRSPSKIEKSVFYSHCLGKEKYAALESAISKWAEEKDIPISFRGVVSQSTHAHRLAQKAYQIGGQDLQLPLLSAIFKAHLEDGKDIAEFTVLAELAVGVNMMTKDEALEFLESGELEKEVNDLCDTARSKGITGVPLTIIDGKWAVGGGQSAEVYVQIFKKLAAAGVYSAPSPFTEPTVIETGICV